MQIDEVRKRVSELLAEIRDIKTENEQQMLKERVSTFTKFQSDSRRDRLQQIKQELEQLAPKNRPLERR
jgi:cell division septum initiation protein DivIVA